MTGTDHMFTVEELEDISDALAGHIGKLQALYRKPMPEQYERIGRVLDLRSKVLGLIKREGIAKEKDHADSDVSTGGRRSDHAT